MNSGELRINMTQQGKLSMLPGLFDPPKAVRISIPFSFDMGVYVKDTKKNKVGDKKKPIHVIPSLNIMLRENYFTRKKRKEMCEELIKKLKIKPKTPYKAIHFKAMRYVTHKLDPIDNLGAGFKSFIDALITQKIISEDNPNVITSVSIEQTLVSSREERRTEISLEIVA